MLWPMTREPRRSPDRQRLEHALEVAGLGEFEWDIARDVYLISARMAAITGLPAGENPARGGGILDDLVHPDDREKVRSARAANLAKHDSFSLEFRLIRP